jgi:hypothetical protein
MRQTWLRETLSHSFLCPIVAMMGLLPVALLCGVLATTGCDAPMKVSLDAASLRALLDSEPVGRYQVVRGATSRETILVDTKTSQTWIVCQTKGDPTGRLNWCPMRFFPGDTAR